MRTFLQVTFVVLFWGAAMHMPAKAAERADVETFLQVTGFDVALESIRLSADSAPLMLGQDKTQYGPQWEHTVSDLFTTEKMRGLAIDILSETLSDKALQHGIAFYGSDLGQRLVEVENTSHMIEANDIKKAQGARLIAEMQDSQPERLSAMTALITALDSTDQAIVAMQELQVRFLLAASAAGVIELRMDEADMRAAFDTQAPELRKSMRESALSSAAFTYRDISDADVRAYAKALEHPDMQELYHLMNAVQFEVTADRFEALAVQMGKLKTAQDL